MTDSPKHFLASQVTDISVILDRLMESLDLFFLPRLTKDYMAEWPTSTMFAIGLVSRKALAHLGRSGIVLFSLIDS